MWREGVRGEGGCGERGLEGKVGVERGGVRGVCVEDMLK